MNLEAIARIGLGLILLFPFGDRAVNGQPPAERPHADQRQGEPPQAATPQVETAPADEDAPATNRSEALRHFESKIRPLLAKHCYECHSAAKGVQKNGLSLDTRHGVRSGGEWGPAIVPGDPSKVGCTARSRTPTPI